MQDGTSDGESEYVQSVVKALIPKDTKAQET
jgi:hypothetical protein